MAHSTISVQGRVEICSIASLTRALLTEGAQIRSKSDVIWRAVEQLSLMYEKKHGEPRFADPAEAMEYMDRVGLSLGTNARAMKALFQAQADQAFFEETGERFSGFLNKEGRTVGAGPDMAALRKQAEEIARRMREEGEIETSSITPEEREEKDRELLRKQREAILGMAKKKGEGE